jgi:lysine biosynthesis protein LysW
MALPREQKAFCPECNSTISFKRTPWLGEKVTCRHCDTDLEVVDLDPIELDWTFDQDNEDDFADYEYEENDKHEEYEDDF